MRKAESYLPLTGALGELAGIVWRDEALKAINEARKEAIEECAKKFTSSEHNRESILSLIKELK